MNESLNQNGGDASDYYDLFNAQFEPRSDNQAVKANSMVLKGIFALAARVGFVLIQAGSIPVKNVYTIVLSNLIEISLVILFYGLIGNRFAFGEVTVVGWVGVDDWDWEDLSATSSDLEEAVIGLCTCLLATAQISSFIVGRTRLAATVLLTIIYCGCFQPFLLHWLWSELGWMKNFDFIGYHVSVKDHAGNLVLHIPSAIFGAIGAIFLGRRIVMLKEIDRLSFGPENVVTTTIGYLLIILNYMVFALPTAHYESTHLPHNYSGVVIINSLIAVACGILTVTVLQSAVYSHLFQYRRMVRCVQGGAAGLISISAGVDVYTPTLAFLISMVSSMFFFLFAEVVQNSALEDPCSFISMHLVCGFLGILVCPLLAHEENLGDAVEGQTLGMHFLWQFLCTLAVIGISVVIALFLFLMLKICGMLRNSFEVINHRRAVFLQNSVPRRAFFGRLFSANTKEYIMPGYRDNYFTRDVGTETTCNRVADTFNSDENTKKSVEFNERESYSS